MLCNRCAPLMSIASVGSCSRCGKGTSSGAHKLCNSCSEEQSRCKACGVEISKK